MARRSTRLALVLGTVAVAVAAALLVWLTRPGDGPATSPPRSLDPGVRDTPDARNEPAARAEPTPPEESAPAPAPAPRDNETSVQLLDMSIAALQQRIDHMDPDSPGAQRMQEELDRLLETREDELERIDAEEVPGLDEYGPVHVGEGVADEDLVAGDD